MFAKEANTGRLFYQFDLDETKLTRLAKDICEYTGNYIGSTEYGHQIWLCNKISDGNIVYASKPSDDFEGVNWVGENETSPEEDINQFANDIRKGYDVILFGQPDDADSLTHTIDLSLY